MQHKNQKKDFKKGKGKRKLFNKNNGNKHNPDNELNEIMQGFLITTDRGKEKQAIKEAYKIIEQHIEKLYPEVSDQMDRLLEQFIQQEIEQKQYHEQKKIKQDEEREQNKEKKLSELVRQDEKEQQMVKEDIQTDEQIQKNDNELLSKDEKEQDEKDQADVQRQSDSESLEEVKQIPEKALEPKKEQYQKRKQWLRQSHIKMLNAFDTRVNCLIFIRLNKRTYPQIDIDLVGDEIMKTVYEERERISRCCYKFVPIKYVFKSSLDEFKIHAKKLIDEYFPKQDKMISWFLWFKARYTDKVSKTDVLRELGNLLEPCYYNDYRDPELVFFVEVNGAIMYLNVLRNYKKYNEYSIKGGFKDEQQNQNQERQQNKQSVNIQDVPDFQKTEFFEDNDVELF